jgi:hypothetical protein
MSLLDAAKADIEQITSDPDGFTRPMTFIAPSGENAAVRGLYSEHHLSVDNEGRPVNSKNAHVSVAEKVLTDLNYPVRINGEVNLSKHLVRVTVNAQGNQIVYGIREWFPSRTVGLITCLLESYVEQSSDTADSTQWGGDSTSPTGDIE